MKSSVKKVLLVDDDEDDSIVFRLALSELQADIQFRWNNSCDNVVRELEQWKPDVVFLDINLPRINGLECLAHIEKAAKLSHVPIIMYSCSELPKDLQCSYELGACLFFRKPSSLSQLTAALADILQMNWHSPATIRQKFYSGGRCYEYTEAR